MHALIMQLLCWVLMTSFLLTLTPETKPSSPALTSPPPPPESGRKLAGNWYIFVSVNFYQSKLNQCWTIKLTCLLQGGRIPFSGQLQNYQEAVDQIVSLLGGEDSAAAHLSKCIFTVGMGSNDYLNNYFMPAFYSTGQQFTPEEFADALIRQYTQQLKVGQLVILQVIA